MQQTGVPLLNIPELSAILLDTNILIDATRHPKQFDPFFDVLHASRITAVAENITRLEYIRGFRPNSREKAQRFLEQLFGSEPLTLTMDASIFDLALRLDAMYQSADYKGVSLADSLIAAQIARYSREDGQKYELLLATQNHKDFPPVLFKRIEEILITLPSGSIKVIGFYRFDRDRARECGVHL